MMKIPRTLVRNVSFVRPSSSGGARCSASMFRTPSRFTSWNRFAYQEPRGFPVARNFSAQADLVSILVREENEEVDSGNTEMPQELNSLKAKLESDWKITDDGAMTFMFLKNTKVQLSFHCQDTIEEDTMEEDSIDDDSDEEPADTVRFTVTVSKAGKTLVYSCMSEFGQARIESVCTSSETPDAVHADQGSLKKAEYQGPAFFDLAEDLQDAFGAYLEDNCAIDEDIAAFVAMYTDWKEQILYVRFLQDTQAVIS